MPGSVAVPVNVMELPSSSVYAVPAFAVGGTLLTVTLAVTMELMPPSSSRTRRPTVLLASFKYVLEGVVRLSPEASTVKTVLS